MASSNDRAFLFDVFLSFCGKDTRDTFTDHLNDKLIHAGISTFRDNEGINKGEKLQSEFKEAIEGSNASIVVLSENYATSGWCLDELALILEQRREYGHFVLPVFYHVEPTDIRKKKGNFDIKVKPSSRWTDDNVKKWEAALVEVADLAGHVVASGPETSILKKIVDTVYNKVEHREVTLPSNIIGMASHEKEIKINSWIEQCNLEFLVIQGMGGSGKTTLAKYIYNSNWKKFEFASFLEDITGGETTMAKLKEQLLKDISWGKKRKIPSVSQGTPKIEHALEMNRALIVLDDVTDRSQLVKLLGTSKINSKSKIVITTRENTDNWFSSLCWKYQKYDMKLLNDDESLELLCHHAFRTKKPVVELEEIVKRTVQYCEGHPMALEVFGSSMYNCYSNKTWESKMRLFESDMNSHLHGVLLRSYESLPFDTVKELFLHIACFFNGIDKDYAEKILEPDYQATSEISTLIQKGLLSVPINKTLKIHRLFQEMGKHIVRQESKIYPAERSRVWLSNDSHKILRKEMGSKKVQGLTLDMKMLGDDFAFKSSKLRTDAFKKMEILKLLQLNFVELGGSYEHVSETLRWLCWHGFHLNTIPSDLYMGSLVAIDMSYSNLEVFETPKDIQCLKILNLKDSHNLREIRNINRIQKLETLILWNCYCLVNICKTIGDLKSLTLLNTAGCKNLFSFEITDPSSTSTPCGVVIEQHTMSFPVSLHRLYLNDCRLKHTDSFPLSFSDQPDLQYLNLGSSLFESFPCDNLQKLRVLDLSFCARLGCLISLPNTLAELYIYGCKLLERITFQSRRFTLQEFGYSGCIELNEVQGLFKLVPISKLAESDLGHLKWLQEYQNHEVCLVGDDELTTGRGTHIQMLYEFDIMSTSLPDINVPIMIPMHISMSPSLSFDVPSCPNNKRLKGINVTFKYSVLGDDWAWFCNISTTNGVVDWMYNPKVFGKPDVGEVCTWLSYWPIGNTLNTGDTVNVSAVVIKGLEVRECCVSLVYSNEESLENNMGWIEILGGDLSRFKLSSRGYYLCRRDYFDLTEVGRLTSDWFVSLVGDTIDYTEIRGWRKTGRPKQVNDPSFTELKTIRCIIHGPQLEDIYKIKEKPGSSSSDETRVFTSSLLKGESIDEPREEYKSGYGISTFDDIPMEESNPHSHGREKRTEAERESLKLSLSNELIKAACTLSMKAHSNQHYLTSNHQGGDASSASSIHVLIIAFKGSMEVEDFYQDDHFGETNVDCNMFPSLQRIGEGQLAKINGSVLQIFQNLLINSKFKLEVDKAVNEGKKILFSGHSSGGAIASLATLWMLDEYTRKRKIRLPIGCVTFGSPLIGDGTLTHAVRREKWAAHFTHFVMQRDIVPRIMLAPNASIKEHLPIILKFVQQQVNPVITKKSPKVFSKKTPYGTIDFDQMVDDNQAIDFFENVLINASTVASHDALDFMEPSNSIKEKLSVDFVKVSPYRPFGIYVFCTTVEELGPSTPRQQLVVENPNVALQLLFYFLQLPNEDQDLSEFALQSLTENFGYEEELNKNGLQLEKRADLKHLNEHLWKSHGTTSDAVRARNKALFELDASAKLCLLAAEEAEKRKKQNEDQIKERMRKYNKRMPEYELKTIEDLIEKILKYKEEHDDGKVDYYEAFKLQNNHDDFTANVYRIEQAKIWDAITKMVMDKNLPDEFEVWDELVDLATQYRRVFEPLDIANYYRHSKGDGYMGARLNRYKFTQRWYEHANATAFELVSESNFVAEVEELMIELVSEDNPVVEVEEPAKEVIKSQKKKIKKKTFEEVSNAFESIKNKVKKWQSDKKTADKDVYWGDSILSKLEEKLTAGNKS